VRPEHLVVLWPYRRSQIDTDAALVIATTSSLAHGYIGIDNSAESRPIRYRPDTRHRKQRQGNRRCRFRSSFLIERVDASHDPSISTSDFSH
jgi:hypothetical protein